ncbi:MAG: Na+/H+ antiporter NhaC [Synergistaceae bacterium]|nr:Na+/H+ antiporter NhaC [Synergistaceae bacterium]MBR2208269.1 Na+/H+ antiporter NhaC [Synergistaceae bacterium]
MEGKNVSLCKRPGLLLSIFVLCISALIVTFGVVDVTLENGSHFGLGLPAQVPLLFATIFAALVGVFYLKQSWGDLEKGMAGAIQVSIQAIIILVLVGCLVGSWIQSGVVATMIYYGLEVMNPRYFYLASLLISVVVALATGCCWTTSSTVGVALIGISAGLGLPLPVTAGFVISGAYFGDKVSPLSDTTNLAPAVSGSELFEHVRAMMTTTLPTLLITAIIAFMMGNSANGSDGGRIALIQSMMQAEFNISLWAFIPPMIILVMAAMKIPAIPGIVSGIMGSIVLSLVRGSTPYETLEVLFSGYVPEYLGNFAAAATPEAMTEITGTFSQVFNSSALSVTSEVFSQVGGLLTQLFTRGGMTSMLETICLIVVALSLGGIMEVCGFLDVILEALMRHVKSVTGIIASVLASAFMANVFLSEQYLSIIVPGRMFKRAFDENTWPAGKSGERKKLAPVMLSRSLEDSGTMTSVLVPWNTCGVYVSSVLGVATLDYLPYCFTNFLNPIVALILTALGIGIVWKDEKVEVREQEKIFISESEAVAVQ